MGNRNNIVSAEKMPEENYGMRPGAQQEVRTFGRQVSHLAFYNFLWCSQAKGEKNPNPGNLDKLTSKLPRLWPLGLGDCHLREDSYSVWMRLGAVLFQDFC